MFMSNNYVSLDSFIMICLKLRIELSVAIISVIGSYLVLNVFITSRRLNKRLR
jgi:hypothetical protein